LKRPLTGCCPSAETHSWSLRLALNPFSARELRDRDRPMEQRSGCDTTWTRYPSTEYPSTEYPSNVFSPTLYPSTCYPSEQTESSLMKPSGIAEPVALANRYGNGKK
jgi:hypothetical protein